MQKPLVIDFTKENASLDIFPSAPLLSSSSYGWNNIYLQVKYLSQMLQALDLMVVMATFVAQWDFPSKL
jgi:hypothetical protein